MLRGHRYGFRSETLRVAGQCFCELAIECWAIFGRNLGDWTKNGISETLRHHPRAVVRRNAAMSILFWL